MQLNAEKKYRNMHKNESCASVFVNAYSANVCTPNFKFACVLDRA